MDPFTQNLINRTKQRQEFLKSKQGGQLQPKNTNEDGESKCTNILKESTISSTGLDSLKSDLKKSATHIEDTEKTGKENEKESARNSPRSKLHQLGAKYSSGENSSTTLASTPSKALETNLDDIPNFGNSDSRKTRLAALAHKISDWEDESNITSKPIISTPVKNSKKDSSYGSKSENKANITTPSKTVSASRFTPIKNSTIQITPSNKMKEELARDRTPSKSSTPVSVTKSTPTKAVESQGFTPSNSRSRLIYDFEKEQEEHFDESGEEETVNSWTYSAGSPQKQLLKSTTNSPVNVACKSPIKPARASPLRTPEPSKEGRKWGKEKTPTQNSVLPSVKASAEAKKPAMIKSPTKVSNNSIVSDNGPPVSVLKRAAMFDSPRPPTKDPAELSLSERKALFEKNKGQPPIPKVSTPAASKPQIFTTPSSAPGGHRNFDLQRRLAEQSLSAHQNASLAKAERMKELEQLRKRYDNQKQKTGNLTEDDPEDQEDCVPPAPPLPGAVDVSPNKKCNSGKIYPGLEEVKRIRVSPPKPGRLYPCLSDIEMTTENESDSEHEEKDADSSMASHAESNPGTLDTSQDLDSSFTADILGRAGLSQFINTPKRKLMEMQQNKHHGLTSINEQKDTSEDDSNNVGDISDLLNEALENSDDDGSTPPKQAKRSKTPEVLEDNGNQIPLYHSVSFYRKQKQDISITPIRQVVRNPDIRPTSSRDRMQEDDSQRVHQHTIHQQIRQLQEEINSQQTVMAQASQALNLCRATAEFSGSTEQVEGERLLLVASQKRQAAINEIQRLKTEAAMGKGNQEFESKGTLSMSNLALPLKKEFLTMLSKGGDDFIHYFLVIIRNRGQVIPTQMLSSIDGVQDGALRFPNLIQLRDLSADFKVSIEVYALQTRKEKLPHEAKYHIRKDSSKMRLTPKKLLNKQESRLLSTPTISSPAGPTAVRTSSFGLVGYTTISPATLRRKHWTLDKVPFASPIDGTFNLKIQCHAESFIEERGFLTVFEDVAGFGAWHRRWCLLSNDRLSFWKYPDDEKRKEPLGHINLRTCVTDHVGVVSRDICARPNTFLLVTVRPHQSGDKDSLVMTCYTHRTALRHLLSADLKEEREVWCSQINKALTNLRAWDPDAQEPTTEGSAPNKKQ